MPEFTREDRNLLVRLGQLLKDQVESAEGAAVAAMAADKPAEAKAARARRDRMLRERRDVEGLRKRLEAAHPDSLKAPATEPAGG